jgi:hypothetical protein
VLFSGEVAEIQWTENAEQVSVAARFRTAPSLVDSLKQIGAAAQQQKKQQQEPPPPPPPDPLSHKGQSPRLVPPLPDEDVVVDGADGEE